MGKLWDKPFRAKEAIASAPRHTRFPKYGGTLIIAIGPPRCGKTHTVQWLMVNAVLRTKLGALVQDPTGNAKATVESYALGLEQVGKRHEAQDLRNLVEYFPGRYTSDMLNRIERIVGDGTSSAKDWQGIVVFDDAGVIRACNPDFFDHSAPLFGNAGLLGYVTEHRDKGIPPAARQCVRRILAWQSPGGKVTLDDIEVSNDGLTPPRSDEVVMLDPLDFKRETFSLKSPPPMILTTPAALTVVRPIVPVI